jgi:hypothetical protein
MPLRPPPRLGHPVDDALRGSILRWFSANGHEPGRVWQTYLSHFACSELSELAHRLEVRYSKQIADAFRDDLEARIRALPDMPPFIGSADKALTTRLDDLEEGFAYELPRCALLALPDSEFLTALENTMNESMQSAYDHDQEPEHYEAARRFINSRFQTLGVPYHHGSVPGTYDPKEIHFDEPGTVEFYRITDPQLEEKVIEPALRVLTDTRFATAADSYAKGLRRAVAPDGRELNDAVLDFGRAVQNALYSLAIALDKRPKAGAAGPLFGLLKGDPLAEDSESLILSVSKLRNPVEHPRGRLIDIQHATAEAAMGAASVAITYIASFMPTRAPADIPITDTAFVHTSPADDIPF